MAISNEDAPKQPEVMEKALLSPQPTVCETINFEPDPDVEAVREAIEGKSSKEDVVINRLARRTNEERLRICNRYKILHGESLVDALTESLTGDLKTVAKALLQSTASYDAKECYRAMEGAGTNEGALIEILGTRDNDQINLLKHAYKRLYGVKLEDRLRSELSGDFLNLCISLLQAQRASGLAVNEATAKRDAEALYNAGEKLAIGTDETVFNRILTTRGFNQLKVIFNEYEKIAEGKTIEDSIKSEMSGDLRAGFLTIVRFCRNRALYFAETLHDAMSGPGTNEGTVHRTLIARADVDMAQIRDEYEKKYEKKLADDIKEDFSGTGKDVLLALLGEVKK